MILKILTIQFANRLEELSSDAVAITAIKYVTIS